MRFLKLFLISVVVFAILVFLVSLLFPSQVRISRSTAIRAASSEVSSSMKDMRNWQQWNEMVANPQLTGLSVSPQKFQSDQLQVLMKEQEPAKYVWLKNGIAIESGFNFIPSASGITIVQWYMDFPIRWYPWEKFSSMLYDKQIGPVMERSLEKFKKMAEDSL